MNHIAAAPGNPLVSHRPRELVSAEMSRPTPPPGARHKDSPNLMDAPAPQPKSMKAGASLRNIYTIPVILPGGGAGPFEPTKFDLLHSARAKLRPQKLCKYITQQRILQRTKRQQKLRHYSFLFSIKSRPISIQRSAISGGRSCARLMAA